MKYSNDLDSAIDNVSKYENITLHRKYTDISLIINGKCIYDLYDSQMKSTFKFKLCNILSDLPLIELGDEFLLHMIFISVFESDSIDKLLSLLSNLFKIGRRNLERLCMKIVYCFTLNFSYGYLNRIANVNLQYYNSDNQLKFLILYPKVVVYLFWIAIYYSSYNIVVFLHDIIKKYNIDPHNDINNLSLRIYQLNDHHWFSKILLENQINDELGILRFRTMKIGYLLVFLHLNYKKLFDKLLSRIDFSAQILVCLLVNDDSLIVKIYDHYNNKYYREYHNRKKVMSGEKESVNIIKWIHNLEHHLSFSKLLLSSSMMSRDVHILNNIIAICGTTLTSFGYFLLKVVCKYDYNMFNIIIKNYAGYLCSLYFYEFFFLSKNLFRTYKRTSKTNSNDMSMEHISRISKHTKNYNKKRKDYFTKAKLINLSFFAGICTLCAYYFIKK